MPLKNKIHINANNNLFLRTNAHLRANSSSVFYVLANRAAWYSTGLFLFISQRSLNGFIPGLMLLCARIKRSLYKRLRLVFEKVVEPFRLNNSKTQCEQCLRVDNSRSGYPEFSLIGCGISEARCLLYIAKGEQRITPLLSYLLERKNTRVLNPWQGKGTSNSVPEI